MSTDRDFGRVEAQIEALQSDMSELKADMKKLLGFRAWLLGLAAAMSAIVSMALEWAKIK